MEKTQVIETLKKEAKSNPTANAVFHVWALRERTRDQVTLEALTAKMHREGYEFEKSEYAALLDKLGKLGFGTIRVKNGRTEALTGVKTTLQSIGSAALGERQRLQDWHQKNRFTELAASAERRQPAEVVPPVVVPTPSEKPAIIERTKIKIVLDINGRSVDVIVPETMRSEDITALIKKLRG